jgi:hypothetical protein
LREVADPIYRAAAGLACVPGKGGAAETRRETRPGVAGADASGKEVPTTGAGESARGRRKRATCGAAGESLTSRPGLSMGERAVRPSWAERRELGYGPDGGWAGAGRGAGPCASGPGEREMGRGRAGALAGGPKEMGAWGVAWLGQLVRDKGGEGSAGASRAGASGARWGTGRSGPPGSRAERRVARDAAARAR